MKLFLNRAFRGMQGVMDDWVYKRFEGRTIASQKPVFDVPRGARGLAAGLAVSCFIGCPKSG